VTCHDLGTAVSALDTDISQACRLSTHLRQNLAPGETVALADDFFQ
jgi:hypothetical protein